MIGSVTSQPEPVLMKVFSQAPKVLAQTAPRVADAITNIQIGKVHPVVDVLDGLVNTTSRPAVTYQIDPMVAARAGFTSEEVTMNAAAILEGEPAATPVLVNDRPYAIT